MAQALDRPVCTATIRDDETVNTTVDGLQRTFSSMAEAIGYLTATAGELGRPVKVTALDPSSTTEPETRLVVDANGAVTADPQALTAKRSSRRSSPRTVTLDDLAPLTETSAPVATAVETAPDLQSCPAGQPWAEDSPSSLDIRGTDTNPALDDKPTDALIAVESDLTEQESRRQTFRPVPLGPADPRLHLRRHEKADTAGTPARAGWRGWCNHTLGLSLRASAAEKASRARRVRIQRPLDTHRTVAVLQLKGGGGKTTTAYHLAATAGRVRGGNILAGEFNENQGTLAERSLAGGHDRTTLDLIRNLETVTRRTADLVRYVRPQGDDRIHVLASPPEGTDRTRVDGRSVRAAHETLRSLYSLILLDTGNSAQSSTWRAAVDVADSLVLVAHNREDDARLLEATVEAVKAEGHGDKLVRSVLVVSNTATDNKERISRLRDYADAIGLAGVVVIPFDKSLQEGRAFNYEALQPSTVRAYEEALAVLTDQL